MTEENMKKELEAFHRLKEASQQRLRESEKSRTRALELVLISKKLLATAKLLQQALSKKER